MKTLVIWLVKKYALSAIKDVVAANKDKVSYYSDKLSFWIGKVKEALSFLEALASRLADGELTDDEATATIDDASKIIDSIKA